MSPGYIFGIYWWLDLIATASLIFDIQFINNEVTSLLAGGDATGFDANDDYASDDEIGGDNLQTATRAARVGSRVSRVLRAVRLLRVMRLTRYTRKKGSPDEIASEESELFRRFSELTARRS